MMMVMRNECMQRYHRARIVGEDVSPEQDGMKKREKEQSTIKSEARKTEVEGEL